MPQKAKANERAKRNKLFNDPKAGKPNKPVKIEKARSKAVNELDDALDDPSRSSSRLAG